MALKEFVMNFEQFSINEGCKKGGKKKLISEIDTEMEETPEEEGSEETAEGDKEAMESFKSELSRLDKTFESNMENLRESFLSEFESIIISESGNLSGLYPFVVEALNATDVETFERIEESLFEYGMFLFEADDASAKAKSKLSEFITKSKDMFMNFLKTRSLKYTMEVEKAKKSFGDDKVGLAKKLTELKTAFDADKAKNKEANAAKVQGFKDKFLNLFRKNKVTTDSKTGGTTTIHKGTGGMNFGGQK